MNFKWLLTTASEGDTMKTFLALSLLCTSAFAAPTFHFLHDENSPLVEEQMRSMAIYRTEARTVTRYGQDPRCGYDTIRYPRYCDRRRPDGSIDRVQCGWHTRTEMRSCYYQETEYFRIFSHNADVLVRIHSYPDLAPLFDNAKEVIDVYVSDDVSDSKAKVAIHDGRYFYDVPKEQYLNLNQRSVTLDVHLRPIGPIREVWNNVKIMDARRVSQTSMEITLDDSQLQYQDAETYYELTLVKIWPGSSRKAVLTAHLKASDLTENNDGTLTAIVDQTNAEFIDGREIWTVDDYSAEVKVTRESQSLYRGNRTSRNSVNFVIKHTELP